MGFTPIGIITMSSAFFSHVGKLAKAESRNPFQTILDFILTDFLPNKNNQAIAESEADNLIESAIGMPIKIHFDAAQANGHDKAIPIGPIQRAWRGVDQGRDVIYAQAIVWNNEHPEIDTFLRTAYAEGTDVGTSWEIKYNHAEQLDGISWLHGVIMAATTIVRNPAYGVARTRLLSVAETIMEDNTTPSDEVLTLQSQLSDLVMALSDMWYEMREQERTDEVLVTAETALTRVSELVAEWKTRKTAMAETATNAETTIVEQTATIAGLNLQVSTLSNDLCFAQRKAALAVVFTPDEITSRRDHILALSETGFSTYVSDLTAVASRNATAEFRTPEFIGSPAKITLDDLVKVFATK